MRIAFVTPEFVTDYADGGGLGNYLLRMAKVLIACGHEPEIFVSSSLDPKNFVHEGIRVERVPPFSRRIWTRLAYRTLRGVGAGDDWFRVLGWIATAQALAAAVDRRHAENPFTIVQSADYLGTGFSVRRLPGRIHVVRCSSAADLYNTADGCVTRLDRWRERLERRCIARAAKAYAPSRFVAEHYRTRYQLSVEVVRPPVSLETRPAADLKIALPERFFVHFGQLRSRKGTPWLGSALESALREEPGLRMVWVGPDYGHEADRMLSKLCPLRGNVVLLPPVPKATLYAILQRAEAAVLPSLVDNLPNTVVESLMLGLPVIGTRGASIDELVEPGISGELVSLGSVDELAKALVKVWRRESTARKGFVWHSPIASEMQPERAVQSLLRAAGLG